MTFAVAVLDDYQGVARSFGPWDALDADVTFFSDHVDGIDALAARLAPFDAIVAMRERTPFDAELLERLPRLRLLVTTGMANASIDLAAAAARGVVVCGTGGAAEPGRRADVGADPRAPAPRARRGRARCARAAGRRRSAPSWRAGRSA